MKYRPEIDGLRAVALVPVILFHAGSGGFSGGFVGVDVFFVISGYLITTIVLSEKELGTFSLTAFYERRARRILPALLLVMLASLPFAWMWLIPSHMKEYSESLLAVSTFSSNLYFSRHAGYWDAANELRPLLHTWSLGVEEQYYVVFPVFLILLWRLGKRWIPVAFLVIAVASFALAHWGAQHKPVLAFYLLPTRAWELAIGAMIACGSLFRKPVFRALSSRKPVDEALGLAGLLMIGYAVFAFDETVPFPGAHALVPTLGAGLIILFSSGKTLVGRLLGAKPLVGIGLMSYSAYLWHQPLLAFARHRSPREPSDVLLLSLAALALPLAYLSWRYVERPFRRGGWASRRMVFTFAAMGSVVFAAVGWAGHITEGFAGRVAASGLTFGAIEAKRKLNHGLSRSCEGSPTSAPDCRTSNDPEVLVWGDSFAMHLVHGILASNPDAKIIQMTKTLCAPFFDIAPVVLPKYPVAWAEGCLKHSMEVRNWLKTNRTVKFAVLSSPFNQFLSNGRLLLRSGEIVEANTGFVTDQFQRTLHELTAMGIKPVVFSPPPANGVDLGRCLSRAEFMGVDLAMCNFRSDEMRQDRLKAYEFLKSFDQEWDVVHLEELLCQSSVCNTHFDSTFIYRDVGHLSREGSAELGRRYDFYGMVVD